MNQSMTGRRLFFMKTNRYGSFLSHMRRLSGCILIILLCLTLCSTLTEPVTVNAAARPVSITSCKLKGKSRIRVTATATNTQKNTWLQMLPFCTGSRKQQSFLFCTSDCICPQIKKDDFFLPFHAKRHQSSLS